jgi:rod shape-determining protein MreC
MFADARYRYLENIRHVIGGALAPVQRAAAMPGEVLAEAAAYFQTQRSLIEENSALRTRLLQQSAAAQGFGSLRQENARLRALLALEPGLPPGAIGAQVLYSGRDPFSQRVVIDRGERGGVGPGMAVIDEAGVVGQVTRAYPTMAEVTLITDKDHPVPVQIERSGVRAVMHGSGVGRAPELRYLPTNADIQAGDRLVTSGIDGVYPPGLAVAEVVAVDRDPSRVFARVVCRPVAGVDRSRQLMVISFVPPPPRPEEPVEAEALRKGSGKGRRG